MANVWNSLDEDGKQAVVNKALEGKPRTAENINRIKATMEADPVYAEKMAREAGVIESDGGELSDEEDVNRENSIESNVDAALSDEGDVQTAGSLPKTVPPPEEGEDVQAYYKRIRGGKNDYTGKDRIGRTAPTDREF